MARHPTVKKVKKLSELVPIIRRAKRRGMKIVTTNGAFDLLHVGHIRNLQFAKAQGDVLVVGVNSDKSVRAYKGPSRPVVGERERAELVASLAPVDHVFIFGDKTPIPWLKKIKPDIHVKGADWKNVGGATGKIKNVVELPLLNKIGAKFVLAPFTKGKSSSEIIKKISRLA